jgi:hypothetical protein
MKPHRDHLRKRTGAAPVSERIQNERFWAHIRTISEEIGYSGPRTGKVHSPSNVGEIITALQSLRLKSEHVATPDGNATVFGQQLLGYLQFRADFLNNDVRPLRMTASEARAEFIRCFKKYRPPPLSLPWNKQKGEMKAPAFLTGIVNMVLAHTLGESSCDFDPLSLTTVTIDGEPFRTLARRVDGAYPAVVNPTAVWEIKEYYYTTTFGSRVADGIYETLLDGLELDGLEQSPHGQIFHYLIVDAADTWWGQGNPYLCRIVDMLHMGYIDEAVFGREVEPAMTAAACEWKKYDQLKPPCAGTLPLEEPAAGIAPPPKHRRLSPSARRKLSMKWNQWASANGLAKYTASEVESDADKAVRLVWQKRTVV